MGGLTDSGGAVTIDGMARDAIDPLGSPPRTGKVVPPAPEHLVMSSLWARAAGRLADGMRRLRSQSPPQPAPGTLPPLRGWTEGEGRCDIVALVYRGVSSDEVEVLTGALATELEGRVVLASPEAGPVVGVEPARLVETVPLDEAPEPMVLVVPGGLAWRREAERAATIGWLRTAAASARGVLAVSTGTLLLAAAGLVEGDEAAGHWLAGDLMAELGVRKSNERVVHDRLVVTASGALAGAAAAQRLAGAVRFSPWVDPDRGGRWAP